MSKDLNKYCEDIKKIKKQGGVKSQKVDIAYSSDDPLVKSYKKVEQLLKKM